MLNINFYLDFSIECEATKVDDVISLCVALRERRAMWWLRLGVMNLFI